jgi:hypothetical protein
VLTTKHLPQSPTGQRFCKFFNHRFNFIKSSYSLTPEWITVSNHPIDHRNLWSAHQDPERLIGLSFGTTTHYAVLDIDRQSPYHPCNSEAQYQELLGAYEAIGINSVLTVQSSLSGGLHVYFVFPKVLPTFGLAHTLRLTAVRAGYEVKDGTLEIFPNTKAYSKQSKTAYKPLRLPLQQGSYLLDKDFVPYSNDIEVFFNQAEAIAEEQDLELLEVAITVANQIKQFRRVKGNGDASSFAQDLREQIAEGWTGSQQTNDLLRIIGTYGRVFKGLEGQALADYIITKAESSPGYRQYCQHQHNIHRRAKDWGRCIEKYYYPYGSEPSRAGTFKQLQKDGGCPEKSPKENLVNQTRQQEAVERIKGGMAQLMDTIKLIPTKVGELKDLLLEAITQLFGKRPSDKTLYRYKEYWHPDHIQTPASVSSDPPATIIVSPELVDDASTQPEVESDKQSPEPSPSKESSLCHTPLEKSPEIIEVHEQVKPLLDEDSSVSATPLRYMKVYELNSCGSGLVSKRFSSTRVSLPKVQSIQFGSKVRLCRGLKHSRHPEIVYVKPAESADDWVDGIAVLRSSLTLLDDS